MNYIGIKIKEVDSVESEIVIAFLSECGYTGFEHVGKELHAYISEEDFDEVCTESVMMEHKLSYEKELIEDQNWNSTWEKSYAPVVVEDFCTVRAAFHDINVTTRYDIIITPQMSFGTGHHATTRLMINMMRDIDMKGRKVLDFGTGTGVLAILAEQLGAQYTLAIDNDEWSYANAAENVSSNSCSNIKVMKSTLDEVEEPFDIILANINRQILVRYMKHMFSLITDNGVLLLSGILKEDEAIITKTATAAGFLSSRKESEEQWLCMEFLKV